MNKIISLLGFLLLTATVAAQTASKPLSVGDYLPDVKLTNFYSEAGHTPGTLAELHEDKLLLIDFWATWCSPCISGLHKLKELKKKLPGRLEVLATGYESRRVIDAFMARDSSLRNTGFPMLVADSLLTFTLFPHRIIPHVVWVDPSGRVAAITGSDEVTEENISRALDGQYPADVKIDLMNFRASIPFTQMDDSKLARSIVTPMLRGASGMVLTEPYGIGLEDSLSGVLGVNVVLESLYRIAAFGFTSGTRNYSRFKFEVSDSTRVFYPSKAPQSFRKKYASEREWKEQNLYCYELTLPYKTTPAQFGRYMVEDLNRYFRLWGRFEKEEIECLVISVPDTAYTRSRMEAVTDTVEEKYDWGHLTRVQGSGVDRLFHFLNRYIFNDYIVDETSIDYVIDVDLSDVRDGVTPEELTDFLARYGLVMSKQKRWVEVFKVSDR